MKKICLSIIASCLLANCAGTLPPINVNSPAGDIIKNAQALAGQFCSIGPTAASIVNIFVSNPLLTTAEDLAKAFCGAIMPVAPSSLRAIRAPLRSGTVLTGTYRSKPISGTVQ